MWLTNAACSFSDLWRRQIGLYASKPIVLCRGRCLNLSVSRHTLQQMLLPYVVIASGGGCGRCRRGHWQGVFLSAHGSFDWCPLNIVLRGGYCRDGVTHAKKRKETDAGFAQGGVHLRVSFIYYQYVFMWWYISGRGALHRGISLPESVTLRG